MNKSMNIESIDDLVLVMGDLKIGQQIVIDRGDYIAEFLSSVKEYTPRLIINNHERKHSLVTEVIEPALAADKLIGWEIGRINKTKESIVQYNLIAMLLDDGRILITRPPRSAISLRNGNLAKGYINADTNALSKVGIGTLAGCFTADKAYPKSNHLTWEGYNLVRPKNAVRIMNICMTMVADDVDELIDHGFNDTEFTGTLNIA